MGRDIRIILAEDSPTVRHHLISIIEETPDMQVIGIAKNGQEALEFIEENLVDLALLDIDTRPAHLAQAKIYAYMYMTENNLKSIDVLLTYIQVSNRKTLHFEKHYSKSQIKSYFDRNIKKYIDWLELLNNHEIDRLKSIEGLIFPFDK